MAHVISGGQVAGLEVGYQGAAPTWLMDGPIESWDDFIAKRIRAIDPLSVWRDQPSVRKVVEFIASALASTPLKVYRRVSDTDRQRITAHPLAQLLKSPGRGFTPYRFWHSVVVDWMIYDRWCVLKLPASGRPMDLVRVQAQRVQFLSDGLAGVAKVEIDGRQKLDPAKCLFDHGYQPLGANGTSPMETLRRQLAESTESIEYRLKLWKQGARIPGVLKRPATAPQWSDGAKSRFSAGWKRYSRGGDNDGGTPILEDGMEYVSMSAMTPEQAENATGRQLADAEVASAFQIAPELVGARQGTYSNIDAFRQMKYRDSLGPLYVAWEQVLNLMLAPELDDTGELYVEADLDAKLRGSFDEQAQVLSTSVGAPWLTRNEARARQNLPAIAGGDALVTPLNVLEGGQASPRDSGSQNAGKARRGLKARAGDTYQARAEQVLKAFFDRQSAEVLAALDQKSAPDWWDGKRWDDALTGDLLKLAALVAGEIGKATAERLGYSPDDYDTDRTVAFLRAVAETRAKNINAATLQRIEAALASEDEAETPAAVFEQAKSNTAPLAAVALITFASGFATAEAARQIGGDRAVKTWDTGTHPRPSHAAMNGETVGIDEPFSNGLMWPGDGGDPDEVAGCNCGVTVEVP